MTTISSRFFRFLIPIAAVGALVLWLVYRQIESSRMAELRQSEEKYVALLGEALADDFQAVVTDLLVLAHDGELQRALAVLATFGGAERPVAPGFDSAAAGFQRFAQQKRVYDQIRYLDADGQEVIRINYHQGQAEVVPRKDLQSKRDRYYFRETMRLEPERVFVSAFDLNVEEGRIEQPLKPTIRFSTPVFDAQHTRRGILVLNYLGQMVLNRFARLDADSPGEAMLLNSDGYWLYDAAHGRQWGFMFPERSDQVFSRDYREAWGRLRQQPEGQFSTADGLFTFETVYPFRRPGSLEPSDSTAENSSVSFDRRWYVVSLVTSPTLSQYVLDLRQGLGLLSLLLAGMICVVSWILARYAEARESSERALRHSEARFRQMADAIAEVFWMSTTQRFELLYASPAFRTIWQCEQTSLEAIGRHWRDSIHPDDRQQTLQILDQIADRDSFNVQYRVVRPAGEPRWIWDQGFVIRDERGQAVGYAGIAEDITTLKTAQQKLLQSERLAAIGEAITGIAHESRNALQRSQACLEMLAKRLGERDDAAGLVERIQAALRDLHYLYQRVRDYAAPLRIDAAPHDLTKLWTQVCDELADEIARRGAVVVSCPQDPASSMDAVCRVDADAMRQVYRNILENALAEDLDAGSQRDQVIIQACWSQPLWRQAPAVELRIRDNGPGFVTDATERIFEPFFTTKTRGTGLGMAISRRIIDAHGGSIDAHSLPGQGLEIHIVLPKGQT
jgi:PAS domain S-box-containing protein